MIRIATFNVRYGTANDGPNRWDARKDLLLDAVRDMDPHVMGVQEALPFQSEEIRMAFPHLDRVGLGRYHGVAVDDRPQESRCGEHCDVFFDSRVFAAESCGTFWHSDTPDTPASISWGNSLARITTWVVLRSRAGGGRFAFFCTHYHGNEPYRTRTTELMIERLRRHAAGLPRVLVGDFNLTPDSWGHRRLTEAEPDGAGLRDVWEALGKQESGAGTCHDWDGRPKTRIDWILAGPELEPVAIERSLYHRGGLFPSDHFPLVAQFAASGPFTG